MSKQFYIPSLGDELILAEDWGFTVINDKRNASLLRWLHHPDYNPNSYYPLNPVTNDRYDWTHRNITRKVALPKGTRLKIDRIYIRKGQDDFNSLTFIAPDLKAMQNGGMKSVRFFAKLDEVNQMVIE